MLNFIKKLFRIEDRNFGVARCNDWPILRKEHLKEHPFCELTGTTEDLEVHHIFPVYLFPKLEREKTNFITLSNKKIRGIRPHQWFGHFGNYKEYNPNVREDIKIWQDKIKNRP